MNNKQCAFITILITFITTVSFIAGAVMANASYGCQ